MAFPEIAGVDMAAGLARIGGSKNRYLELLEMFCRDAEAGFALLEKEPDNASLRAFTTLVHALKSALANIGADCLSQSAALLEKAGREADLPMIRDRLPPFREELAALVERIGGITAAAPAADGETPGIGEALARLREALEAKDIDATDAELARLQALPLTGKMSEAISEIADLVLMMEFKKAESIATSLWADF
jgi:HPt (histidine-containing phosphotransfer) domain-containing protein